MKQHTTREQTNELIQLGLLAPIRIVSDYRAPTEEVFIIKLGKRI